jgi:hypothetical protein
LEIVKVWNATPYFYMQMMTMMTTSLKVLPLKTIPTRKAKGMLLRQWWNRVVCKHVRHPLVSQVGKLFNITTSQRSVKVDMLKKTLDFELLNELITFSL